LVHHRKVVLGAQLAGLAAAAAALLFSIAGETGPGAAFLSAALVLLAGSTLALVRNRSVPAAAPAAPAAPPAPAVGRLAGLDTGSAEDPRSYLGELILEPRGSAAECHGTVLIISGPELARRLQAHGPVEHLLPGASSAQLLRGAPRMLVIDRRGLGSGLWAHTETGAGSVLFRELSEVIRKCQRLHIATVFLDSGEPDRFYTSTLRKLCRNTMPLAFDELHPEGTVGSDLLTELQTWSLTEAAHVR
jgi:hypothetical protein